MSNDPANARLTLIGGVLDLFLGFVKVLVGYIGNSQALIADGIHSLSDLITDILVLVATKQSAQAADEGHPYGHDRIQTLVSLALAGSLGIIAIVIAWDAVIRIVSPESPYPVHCRAVRLVRCERNQPEFRLQQSIVRRMP